MMISWWSWSSNVPSGWIKRVQTSRECPRWWPGLPMGWEKQERRRERKASRGRWGWFRHCNLYLVVREDWWLDNVAIRIGEISNGVSWNFSVLLFYLSKKMEKGREADSSHCSEWCCAVCASLTFQVSWRETTRRIGLVDCSDRWMSATLSVYLKRKDDEDEVGREKNGLKCSLWPKRKENLPRELFDLKLSVCFGKIVSTHTQLWENGRDGLDDDSAYLFFAEKDECLSPLSFSCRLVVHLSEQTHNNVSVILLSYFSFLGS